MSSEGALLRYRRSRRAAVLLVLGAAMAVLLAVLEPWSGPGRAGAKPSTAVLPLAGPPGTPDCAYPRSAEGPTRPVPLPPTVGVETWRVYQVSLVTSRGDIVFELDSALAPCTANNFRSLAHFRFFDKTPCHRLTTVALRVLQCGDPTGTGRGGPGYSFADEEQSGVTYPRGTVAMASGGPDTNGSQFFIVYGDSNLPTNFTVFGQVTAGMRILDGIAAGGSDGTYGRGDGRPLSPVDITTVRVQPSARPAASPTGR